MDTRDYSIVKTIQKQLFAGDRNIPLSWGPHEYIATYTDGKPALQFKVQGFKFKGLVNIAYNQGKDLYELRFIQYRGRNVKHFVDEVYAEDMVGIIDRYVETDDPNSEEYHNKVANAKYKF